MRVHEPKSNTIAFKEAIIVSMDNKIDIRLLMIKQDLVFSQYTSPANWLSVLQKINEYNCIVLLEIRDSTGQSQIDLINAVNKYVL